MRKVVLPYAFPISLAKVSAKTQVRAEMLYQVHGGNNNDVPANFVERDAT